jgi:predicted nucleic acid-binding protein
VSLAALEAAIPAGETILLDTSAILAYLSGSERASAIAAVLIDELVGTGRNPAVVSAISVCEVLVRPNRAGSPSAVRLVDDFVTHFPNLRVEPVTIEIARMGARIRAATVAPAPDALILATAVDRSASVAVGNDAGWPAVVERAGLPLKVVVLGSLVDEVQAAKPRRHRRGVRAIDRSTGT